MTSDFSTSEATTSGSLGASLAGVRLLAAILAGPAYGQTRSELVCGTLKAESWKTAATTHWTIAGPSEKVTETGVLKSGPRLECIDGAVLGVEFASSAGHSIFTAYFPDGTNIAYGRQQIDRRGGRIVLPIQAKARIAAEVETHVWPMVASGAVKVVLDSEFPLPEAPAAHWRIEAPGHIGKIVLKVEE